jgi:hypothetical protein
MPLAEGDKASICHPVCALVLAVMIGGASMGSDASLGATELDSHATWLLQAATVQQLPQAVIMQTLPPSLQTFL